MLDARAGTALAELLLDRADSDRNDSDRNDLDAAVTAATEALASHRRAGHRPGEEHTIAVLARAGGQS